MRKKLVITTIALVILTLSAAPFPVHNTQAEQRPQQKRIPPEAILLDDKEQAELQQAAEDIGVAQIGVERAEAELRSARNYKQALKIQFDALRNRIIGDRGKPPSKWALTEDLKHIYPLPVSPAPAPPAASQSNNKP